jgi:hypothetical protein
MRDQRSLRGFSAGAVGGVLVGMILGSTGMAVASFGYEGWQRFSEDFKVGYVTGFIAMANLARNLDPGGWVDMKYPQVDKAKPSEVAAVVTDLYKKPENKDYSMASILQAATHDLEKKYGKALSSDERIHAKMNQQLEAMRKKREAAGLASKDSTTKVVEAPPAVVAPPAEALVAAKRPRKWCRCDGTDPKEATARRRAAAAAEEAKEEAEDAKAAKAAADAKAAAGNAKTPPAATKQDAPAAK